MSPSGKQAAQCRLTLGFAVLWTRPTPTRCCRSRIRRSEALWLIDHALGLTGLHQIVDRERSV